MEPSNPYPKPVALPWTATDMGVILMAQQVKETDLAFALGSWEAMLVCLGFLARLRVAAGLRVRLGWRGTRGPGN